MIRRRPTVCMYGVFQVLTDAVRRFEQPEYTGENRCLPCTVLNSAIVVILVVLVAIFSITGAAILLAVGVATILFRGYFVPGTPTLVGYLPDAIHDVINPKHGTAHTGGTDDADVADGTRVANGTDRTSIDIETALESAGIVVNCPDIDDLRLTDQYHAAWQSRIDELQTERTQRDRLANSLSISPDEVTFEETEDGWFVLVDDSRVGGWGSKAAFLADLAGNELLESRLPDWNEFSPQDRTHVLATLRSFLDTCPTCGGDIVPNEAVVRSCCRNDLTSVTTTCTECDSVLFEGTLS